MKRTSFAAGAAIIGLFAIPALAGVYYVDVAGTNPTPPFNDWSTAATNIQDAIDVASPGDLVLVTNGIYETGGRLVSGALTNRVALTKALAVQSVNGPAETVIRGHQVPVTTNGDSAVRCIYMTNGASLSGFTLLGGATRQVNYYDETSGGGLFCESTNALIANCVVVSNTAHQDAGGAFKGTFSNCIFKNNSAGVYAGGVMYSMAVNCLFAGNQAGSAAGMSSTLYNCVISNNLAGIGGTAVEGGSLNNCLIIGNIAYTDFYSAYPGSGVRFVTARNCTIVGNSAYGTYGGSLLNCIIYNNAFSNYWNGTFTNCCTTPLPGIGTGNISSDPQLASPAHISASSPCRGAGSTAYASGTDIDGEPWQSPPSIGCDEYMVGNLSGPLNAVPGLNSTNMIPGFVVRATALIDGHSKSSSWDFGDGITLSNRALATHSWISTGDYPVVLTAWNDSNPGGISATTIVHVVTDPQVRYANASSPNPMPPYLDWSTAASSIQDAVDFAAPGYLVLVTNGVYQTGGRTPPSIPPTGFSGFTRVVVTNPITLQSLNGPEVTIIRGGLASYTLRCAWLADGVRFSGFTVTNGEDFYGYGGGIFCQSRSVSVSNCVIIGNKAKNAGSGVFSGTLYDCEIISNSVSASGGLYLGGAAHDASLDNCTLAGNSSADGGAGLARCDARDCLIISNFASWGAGAVDSRLSNCVLSNNSASYSGGAFQTSMQSGSLNNCTIINNSARIGGAIYGNPTVTNCTFIGNKAVGTGGAVHGLASTTLNSCLFMNNSAGQGGATESCTLINCLLFGNSAETNGGGTAHSKLFNCTVVANSATNSGGGSWNDTFVRNSIVYLNSAPSGSNWVSGTWNFSCTTPMPTTFAGNNITNTPRFVDATAGDFHLQPDSPCVNAGFNGYLMSFTDLDGNTRIAGNTIDIGAYEFQSPASILSYAWLQQYGLPTDGSADFIDTDADSMNNWQEWRAATDPTNSFSVLKLLAPSNSIAGVTLRWQSTSGRSYYLQRTASLTPPVTFQTLQSNITAFSSTTSFTDTNAVNAGPFFYRVGVQY